MVQREKDNFSEADKHFTKARSSFEALGSKVMALHVMLNTADLHRLQNQFEKSWEICEDIIERAREINTQEIISDVKQQQAKIRITQALKTKKLAVTFLEEAKQLLLEIKQHIEQAEGSIPTKFEVYFDLSQVYYHLGNPEGTMEFYGLAQDIQTSILAHIKDENAQRMFLQRRSNREFTAYKKTIKV
jgi:tetratricopeptide (TPR) repeat protein